MWEGRTRNSNSGNPLARLSHPVRRVQNAASSRYVVGPVSTHIWSTRLRVPPSHVVGGGRCRSPRCRKTQKVTPAGE